MVDPLEVDIRTAIGRPSGNNTPIKMTCPLHKERIGVEDDRASLAVYRANCHCFGCSYHITRRYASLAFLLGEWDGRGDENSTKVREAVKRIKKRLPEFVSGKDKEPVSWTPPPVSPYTVEAFHQYMLRYAEGRMVDELMKKRGLTLETIREYKLGYTGTHFTLPVFGLDGSVQTIRYRADDRVLNPDDSDYRKYEGTWGHNSPVLYALPTLRGISSLDELWVVEGEFDQLASNQAGNATVTVTNGATNVSKLPEMVGEQLPRLRVNRWIVAVDQDQAGELAASQVIAVLDARSQKSVRARWSHGKDLTEYYAGGGSRGRISYERAV